MKSSIAVRIRNFFIVILALLMAVAVVGLAACSDDEQAGDGETPTDEQRDTGENESVSGQAPVYQGMVISSTRNAVSTYVADNFTGDFVGKEDLIDADMPFGEDSATLEDELEQEFKVVGGRQDIYYADLNEDIYITVIFSNPGNFEILSFAINGKTYASYMFESGSDMENIIIKLNVGSVAGFNDYVISEIKYVDGTEIKDVLLNGDTSVRCGVRGEEEVRASVSNEAVTLDSISFSAKIVDVYSLVEESGGFVKAVLYDGTDILEMADLEVGNNEVEFDGLYPNTLYQYAIVAEYDDLSGDGVQLFYLYKNTVYTEALILFKDVEVTKTSVSFDFEWYPGYDDSSLHTKFTLEGASSRFVELDPSSREITDLLSNHEYTLNVAYTGIYGETEAIRLTFTTLAMETPEVDIEITEITKNSVSYEIAVTDEDETGEILSMALLLEDTQVKIIEDKEGTLENLLSGEEYTIVVVYEYDLNDGEGTRTLEVCESATTLPKAAPEVSISSLTATNTGISYEVSVTDVDGVGEITSVTLSHDGDEDIAGSTASSGTFENLLSDNEYTLTVVYAFDLNDGEGEREMTVSQSVCTRAMVAPSAEIALTGVSSDELTFNVTFRDEDGIGSITSIGLYAGDELASEDTAAYTGEMTYSNLSSYTSYTLIVSYKYDLNDGRGEKHGTVELLALTDPKIEFESVRVLNTDNVMEGDEISIRITVANPDGVRFTSVVINGVSYEPSSLSTSTNIFVNILDDGQFEGGETEFVVTEITGVLNGVEYTVAVGGDNSATAFINGELTVEDFSIVTAASEEGEERLYRFSGENLYYKIDLNNSTGYDVSSVIIDGTAYSGSSLIFSDDKKTIYLAMPSDIETGWCTTALTAIYYGNDSIGEKAKTYDMSLTYVRLSVSSGEIVEISTAEELMTIDMTGWKYYRLANDIDLDGYNWINVGNSLQGVFDGNGYTVSNMMSVTTRSDADLYLGLFHSVEGVVMNLEICDVLYIVTVTNDATQKAYDVYAGAVAATSGQMILSQVHIDASFQIVNETGGTTYIGVLSGSGSSATELYSVTGKLSGKITGSNYSSNGYFGKGSISGSKIADTRCDCSLTISTSGSSTLESTEGYVQDGEFLFAVSNGAYTLVDYLGADKSITLPSYIDGHSYKIGDYAFSGSNLTSVTIPEGVTEIGYYAFYNCRSLVSVTLPESLTIIGDYAFYNCSALTSITIPEGVTNLGIRAFYGCSALKEIYYNAANASFSSSFSYSPFYSVGAAGNSLTLVIGANVSNIPDCMFYYANITELIFENGSNCASIGDWAFYNCIYLTTIMLPASLTKIGSFAFDDCTSLTAIYYMGDANGWDKISMSGFSFPSNTNITLYVYSDEPYEIEGAGLWHYDENGNIAIWS